MLLGCIARVVLVSVVASTVACAKRNEEKGDSIGAPEVQPPVAENLPTGFGASATGLNLQDDATATMMAALKGFVYPTNGFVGPIDRLGKVDDRMAELDKRAEENQRACLGEDAKAFQLASTMGDGTTFDMKFSCQESVTVPEGDAKESQVGFGFDSDHFYLMERTISMSGGGILVFVKEPKTGESNEVWDVRFKKATEAGINLDVVTWLHIKGYAGGAEIVTASSNAIDGAMSCGVQMKANSQYVYVYGTVHAGGACGDREAYCADSTTLATVELAKCTEAGLDDFSMTAMTADSVAATTTNGEALTNAAIAGFTDFNDEE